MATVFESVSRQVSYLDMAVMPILLLGTLTYFLSASNWGRQDPYHYKWFERPQVSMVKITRQQKTRDISDKLEESGRHVVIFWGSQSGTAEGYAHRLAKELHQRLRLECLVADLSDYDPETIPKIPPTKLAIFLVSTYGEGDPSDNGWDFVRWLESLSQNDALKTVHFAAFGFGNSNYKHYNKVVEVVATTMVARGASLLLPVGKADEGQSMTEEDYMAWKEGLIPFLRTHLGYKEHVGKYEAAIDVSDDPSPQHGKFENGYPVHKIQKRGIASAIASFEVLAHRSLISKQSHEGDCIHMDIDISGHPEIKYKTGDHVAIWPVNPRDEVDRLLQVLDIQSNGDQRIVIQPNDPETELRIPRRTTLHALFEHYLDICAPVPRQVVLNLVDFATSDIVKATLGEIGKDKFTYSTFLASTHLTFAALLAYTSVLDPNVNWSSLPLSFVVESIPPMSPRYYSISSSSITSPRRVSITVSVKPTLLALKPEVAIFGLTSRYLSSFGTSLCQYPRATQDQNPLQTIQAQIRRSNFKLPTASTVPLVLVAAGTGIAPMRAFILERARLAVMGRQTGNIILFFGCRNPDIDFLYRDELAAVAAGPLKGKLELVPAYSRVPGKEKRYVQDAVQERMDDVGRLLLDQNASFCVCGSTQMAKSVERVIVLAIKEVQEWDDQKVTEWKVGKKRSRRWNEDVWG